MKVKFPNFLKPNYVNKDQLVRVGSIDDGGYVVPLLNIKDSEILISMGISDNWDFEKDFSKISNAKILAYDDTINLKYWIKRFKKDLIKFLKLKIFKPRKLYKMFQYVDFLLFFKKNNKNKFFLKRVGNDINSISINDIDLSEIKDNHKVFLKIDIEGSEYEILDQIVSIKRKIQGIVIEFHEVTSNLDKIRNFLKAIEDDLKLVHIHANNYSLKEFDQFPNTIELTISNLNKLDDKKQENNKSHEYPLEGLDYPNSKRSPEIKIIF